MMRRSTLLPLALLLACASPPLGDDWAALDPAGRDARAVEVLRDLFAARVDGVGDPVPALVVERADPRQIVWRGADGVESRLSWLDVDSVEAQVLSELPARPESLYLYLVPGSPSSASVIEAEAPLLSRVGVTRPFLHLPQRPARARERAVAALGHLRARALSAPLPAAASAAPVASPAVPAPGALDEAQALLERLKQWREAGLITPEEHERKRREVLDRLGTPPGGGD